MVRVKHRYFLVEVLCDQFKKKLELPLKQTEILRAVKSSVEKLHGDFGVACIQIGLALKMYNTTTRVFLLRVRRASSHYISTSLPFVTSIGRFTVVLRLLHVSGTIRKSLKFLVSCDQQKLNKLLKDSDIRTRSEITAKTLSCYEKLREPNLKVPESLAIAENGSKIVGN